MAKLTPADQAAYRAFVRGETGSLHREQRADTARRAAISPSNAAPTHHGGSLGGNLLHDIEQGVTGVVPGIVGTIEHPIRAGKQMGHQYGAYYGPLVHGHVGKFLHNVHEHPLQLGLDAATIAASIGTLGAAAAPALGLDESLDAARILSATAPTGERVVTRIGSRNPVILARQKAVNAALNKLPKGTKVVGTDARVARAVARAGDPATALATRASRPGGAIEMFHRLKGHEKKASFLRLQGLKPEEYYKLGNVPADVAKAAANPSKRMLRYEKSMRQFAPHAEMHMVNHLGLDPQQALYRRYAPLMIARKTTDLKALQKEFAGNEPIYIHHAGKEPSFMQFAQAGARASVRNAPAKVSAMKGFAGTLQEQGLLDLEKNPLQGIPTLVKYAQRSLIRRQVLDHIAVDVPQAEWKSKMAEGFVPIKAKLGEKPMKYTEALLNDEEWLGTKGLEGEKAYVDPKSKTVKMIPKNIADLLQGTARVPDSHLTKFLYGQPTQIWKKLVLGLRPAYAVNIITSQHILGALQASGRHGIQSYFNHLAPGARLGKLTDGVVEHVWPEQAMASFTAHSGDRLAGMEHLKQSRITASRVSSGVMPAVMKTENWLRRLMLEGWTKDILYRDPRFQEIMKHFDGNFNQALMFAKASGQFDKQLEEVSRRVDHSQGNYRDYSPAEQKLRQIIPFYGWDRHIVQSTYRLLGERPQLAAAGTVVGRYGSNINQKQFGALPPYLQGIVHLSHLPSWMGSTTGLTPSILPRALEPFNEDVNLMHAAQAVLPGKQAGTESEALSTMNPLLQGVYEQITGRNPVTGGTVHDKAPFGMGNVLARTLLNTPQARLIEGSTGKYPWGIGAPSKHPTYKADMESQLAAFLGFPVKKLNKYRAHVAAQAAGKPPR